MTKALFSRLRIPFDGFLLALAPAVGLAILAPQIAADGSPVPFGDITDVGIALVFFLHGANLSPAALRDDTRAWRLHILVQVCTFVYFPILGAIVYLATETYIAPEMRLGFFTYALRCLWPRAISLRRFSMSRFRA